MKFVVINTKKKSAVPSDDVSMQKFTSQHRIQCHKYCFESNVVSPEPWITMGYHIFQKQFVKTAVQKAFWGLCFQTAMDYWNRRRRHNAKCLSFVDIQSDKYTVNLWYWAPGSTGTEYSLKCVISWKCLWILPSVGQHTAASVGQIRPKV